MNQEKKPNRCIRCSVQDCKYHHQKENYCSLNEILVAGNVKNPTDENCVDCKSFVCSHEGQHTC